MGNLHRVALFTQNLCPPPTLNNKPSISVTLLQGGVPLNDVAMITPRGEISNAGTLRLFKLVKAPQLLNRNVALRDLQP